MSVINRESLIEAIELRQGILRNPAGGEAQGLAWALSRVKHFPEAAPEWKSVDVLPTREDADQAGNVLAWHKYNGAMNAHISAVQTNASKMFTHWMRLPAKP